MADDNYQKVAELCDLDSDEGKNVEIGDVQIALFKVSDTEVCAIGNICPHQGGPLADGYYDNDECVVTCPLHAWDFDIRTGRRINGIESVPVYKTRIEGDDIKVCVD